MKALIFLCALVLGSSALAATDSPPPKEVVINGVEFIHVPEGWFYYGIDTHNARRTEKPDGSGWYRDVKVWLDGYYMAKFEARARDFKRFMESDKVTHRDQYASGDIEGCSVRKNSEGGYYLTDHEADLPATHLSWQLADEFARWMGFRLPSEAEWVKAARGTDKRVFPWGNEYPDDTFAGYGAGMACHTGPVDAFSNGRSPYGIYNMAGNAYEFVADWYNDDFDYGLKDGDRNPPLAAKGAVVDDLPEPMKILKGGRWASTADGLTVYTRSRYPPHGSFSCYGARFALDVAAVRKHLASGTAKIVSE